MSNATPAPAATPLSVIPAKAGMTESGWGSGMIVGRVSDRLS